MKRTNDFSELGFVYGNLLDFPFGINTIAHSCNTLNIMGGGIAKQISNRYPDAFEADTVASNLNENKLGSYSYAEVDVEDEKYPHQQFGRKIKTCWVYNLYTQCSIGYGRQVNYEALYNSLESLKNTLNGESSPVLGVPYGLSCGLAGGNWNVVFSMLNNIFTHDVNFKTYVVKYIK